MTTPEEIARIAKGLTKAQRLWLLSGRQPQGGGKWPVHNALIDKGLAKGWPWTLTPLGLAIRTYLMENPQ